MADLTYEEISSSTYTNPVTSFENQSVIFVFDNGLPPIACTLDFLFTSTTKNIQMKIENYNSINVGSSLNVDINGYKSETYQFIYFNIIHNLAFKYGLIGEYYKNSYGNWVDMSAVRKQFTGSSNVFSNLYTGYTINDKTKLTSLYTRIADNSIFRNTEETSLYYNYLIHDKSVLPASEYYLSDGTILNISEEDGGVQYTKCTERVMEKNGLRLEDDLNAYLSSISSSDGNNTEATNSVSLTYSEVDKTIVLIPDTDTVYYTRSGNNYTKCINLLVWDSETTYYTCDISNTISEENVDATIVTTTNSDRATFTTQICNYETGETGSGTYNDNNHHHYDDLKLIFTKKDESSTPYTDLDNLLIILNGMVVNYVRSETMSNAIYIVNVIRFAGTQWTGLKAGCVPSSYYKIESVGNADAIYYDVPVDDRGYSYDFDIRIYQWKNVSVSKFIEPINSVTTLKTESVSSNTFWLTTDLIFSDDLIKGKFILLNNNEIIPSTEYTIDTDNPKKINLTRVSSEYDILYSEMTQKLNAYLYQTLQRDDDAMPQISDYVTDYTDSTVTNQQFLNYIDAMNAYYSEASANGTYANLHNTMSPLFTVSQEFKGRTYSIIKFDTIEEKNYNIKVRENRADISINRPYMNKLENKSWGMNDILVVNGLIHRFINEYSNVFVVPTTTYLPTDDQCLVGADAYKLQIVRN